MNSNLWQYKGDFNADHKIIDFEPRLNLKHHTQVQNAKRYLRHLENHHADFLFRKNNKGRLMAPWNYVKDAIYELSLIHI